MKKRYIVISIFIILILLASIVLMAMDYNKKIHRTVEKSTPPNYQEYESNKTTFMYNMLKQINEENKGNYLISPYSINTALGMVRDGSKGDTYQQIVNIIGNEKPVVINNENIKISNAMFTKNKYKEYVSESYVNKLKSEYDSEFLFDEFKTPKVINDWVNEKTNKMIPKLLEEMDSDFVLGLANAIAIDVKWGNKFECVATGSEEFTAQGNKTMNVEMMHNTYKYGATYLESDKAKGIIIPYEEETNLEYIAILPNEDINAYIKSFDEKEFKALEDNKKDSGEKIHINLSLPRYTYDYDLSSFKLLLQKNGMVDAFDPEKSDLTGIISREDMGKAGLSNLYIETAIHKTHIALNEEGTKAAAVTFFGVNDATAFKPERDYEVIDIKFNKPFIYMIREKTTNSILFLGVVNKPNEWKGSTCEER